MSVAIITGGAGGMGLATARLLAPTHRLLITDVSEERVEAAVAELTGAGADVEGIPADVTDGAAMRSLVGRGAELGEIGAVVHTAGVSPQMGDAEFIIRINALGTVNLTRALLPHAGEHTVLINIASIAGHFLPGVIVPTRAFPLAESDPERFVAKLASRARLGRSQTAGLAYGLSKAFVLWYTERTAERFGARGARVLSVSPGTFDTEMGRLEEKSGSADLLHAAALKRYGRPEEIAELLAFLASGKAAYLTGTDILIDGGTLAGVHTHGRSAMRPPKN